MKTKVKELTVEELQTIISITVKESLEEIIEDPPGSFKQRLFGVN